MLYPDAYFEMDLIWYGMENEISAAEVSAIIGKTTDEIKHKQQL